MSESFEKAVEAAARDAYERAWGSEREPWSELDDLERDEWRADAAAMLRAALPHLTAQDVPHLIRQAKAEAWGEGWRRAVDAHPSWWSDPKYSRNPYAEEADHE